MDKTLPPGAGKRVVVVDPTYEPYFYILPKNLDQAKKEIESLLKKKNVKLKRIEETRRVLFGEEKELIRVSCFLPRDTGKVRDVVKTIEKKRGGSGSRLDEYKYAMGFYRSYMVDKGISSLDWLGVEGEPITGDFDIEFAEFKKIDTDYYINNQILHVSLRILKILGVGEERLLKD